MDQAEPGVPRRLSPIATVLLADNPGPMTLDGTNSYVLGDGSGPALVVDPGPDDETHRAALAALGGGVGTILLTHRHADHTAGAAALRTMTGAPIRAADAALCAGGPALRDGEVIAFPGGSCRILATPGHTADSICVVVEGGAVLTGDTVLGRGTTVIDHPDGRLADYLRSLDLLRACGSRPVWPGHGPTLPDLAAVAAQYRAHRLARLDQVRAAVDRLGAGASAEAVTDLVYPDAAADVRRAALLSVRAQLEYLGG